MTKTDPTVRLARKIAADSVALPRAVEAWLTDVRLNTADGYGSGRSTDHGPRALGTISDPTGDQAARNTTGTGRGYGPTDEHQLVHDTLVQIAASFEVLERFIAKRDVHHGVTQTCSGGHLPGAQIPQSAGGWHDATCSKPAELHRTDDGGYSLRYQGLCLACHRRFYRWKERTNVTTANTGVTSGDA